MDENPDSENKAEKHGSEIKSKEAGMNVQSVKEDSNKRKFEELDLEIQNHEIGYDQRFEDPDYDVDDDSDLDDLLKDRENEWYDVSDNINGQAVLSTIELTDAESDPDCIELGDDIDSEGLHSHSSSGSDKENWGKQKVRILKRFVQPLASEDVHFEIGQLFISKKEFQLACKHHGTIDHRKIRYRRTNTKRCTVICKTTEKCNWKVSVNFRPAIERWELTSLMASHTCTPTFNHSCTNDAYLSRRYKEEIKIMPNMKISQLVEKVRKDLHINISRAKAFNAKKLATKEIEGDLKEQYSLIREYCNELRRANPNSTILLQTEENAARRELFFRIYVCFEACKRGFVEVCRPMIGMDGCHLTGPHKGILLAAIGMDANDQIFPIAYAVVEIENKSSWLWFLTALQHDLGIQNSQRWTLLSDKQKGLDSAMKALLPNVEHRLCTWHMYKNFKDSYPSLELKEMVWAAAKCTHPNQFDHQMNRIKKTNVHAFEWLGKRTKFKDWSRAFFNTESKCDILVNNICECFNRVILHARDKPLLPMLEALRFYFMDRLQKKRVFLSKMKGQLGPKVKKKLEKNMAESNQCRATHSGELRYEVQTFSRTQYVVDLRNRTCGCRRWELTGIPCPHAVAAISLTKEEPESFVDACYSKNAYLSAYNYTIYPINGPDMWERGDCPGLLAPKDMRLPGRPAKVRKKDVSEKMEKKKQKKNDGLQKLSRVGKTGSYKCSICGLHGHNCQRCPTKEASSSVQPSQARERKVVAKSKGKGVQQCSLCKKFGHNKTKCTSSIAAMNVQLIS